jgi:hypothetical protein
LPPGFRYRLHSREMDELGEFTTIVPNWTSGDTFTAADGRRFRILRMVPVTDVEGAVFEGMWEVAPVEEPLREAGATGLEPATSGFGDQRSTN